MDQQNIELSEIVAVRLKCKACGAVLSVPLPFPAASETPHRLNRLRACPYCKEAWIGIEGVPGDDYSIQTPMQQAIESIWRLLFRMNPDPTNADDRRFRGGFTISLEIKTKD